MNEKRSLIQKTAASCLAAITLLTACSTSRNNRPINEADYRAPIRVACIGDSITYGYGITDRERNSYPAQLQNLLGSHWEVRNFGVNGATALKSGTRSYASLPQYREALSFKPDVVILKLGTNDTNAKSWPAYSGEFSEDYSEIIRSFKTLETHPRIYLVIPVPLFRDRGKEYDTDKILVEEVIPKIKEVAHNEKLPLIDLYAALKGKPERLPDGVHPDGTGARIMSETIYSILTRRPATQLSK